MRGFTLLEVMLALAIIAGVVFTVIGSVNYHLSIVARDRAETVAMLLGRGKLEELEQEKDLQDKTEGTFAPARPDYAWKWETAPMEVPGFKKVTLTVSWEEKKRSLALVHYVAK